VINVAKAGTNHPRTRTILRLPIVHAIAVTSSFRGLR
jgi:hypothetical protein